MKEKFLSIFLALCMCLSLMPTVAFAADPEPDGSAANPYLLTQGNVDADGKLSLEADKHYKLSENIGVKETLSLKGSGSLDLNGHVLYRNRDINSTNTFIKKGDAGTYTLLDSSTATPETAPKHYFTVQEDGLWIWEKDLETTPLTNPGSYKVVSGGVITGGNYDDGGGLSITGNGATVELKSGSIVGCYAGNKGGAVYTNEYRRNFIMSGGSIKGCVSERGGALCAKSRGTLKMSGGTIEDCVALDDTSTSVVKGRGGAVYVESGAVFTMTGGTIKNCKTVYADGTGGEGGAVYTAGTFKMNAATGGSGGTIENCSSASNGGAVYVDTNGDFTMTAGTIRNSLTNSARQYYGGGVYNKGEFTMTGGTISNCEAYEGGGVYNNGTFKMEAGTGSTSGTIEDCKANSKGGGVFNVSTKTFTMSAGRIKDCCTLNSFGSDTIDGKGGGVYNNGTFNLSGGDIMGSVCAAIEGAAVSNDAGGTFNMTNGTISATSNNDNVERGGGVSNTASGVTSTAFNMSGGSIRGTFAEIGGGVYNKGAAFNMSGGIISGCTATTGEGGNIYNQGTLKLSGTAEVGTSPSATAIKQVAGDAEYYTVKFNTDGGIVNGKTEIDAGSIEQSADATAPTVFYADPYFEVGTRPGNIVLFTSDNAFYALEVISSGNEAIAPIAPTKTGFTFKGWNLDSNRFTFDDAGITADTTLVAAWRDSSSTEHDVLKRSATGGSFVTDKASADEAETVTVTVTPNAHYSIGTVTATYSNGGSSTPVTVSQVEGEPGKYTFTMPAGDVTIAVTFVRDIYTITLNVNGGNTLSGGNTLTTNAEGKLATLPTPTRSNYRFAGWFTEATGGTQVTTDTVINASTTLYAHWTEPGTSASDPIVLMQSDITQGSTLTLKDGKYYKLGEDITIPNPTNYSWELKAITVSGNVTLNLNGYALKGPGMDDTTSNLNGAIVINDGAMLTLEDNYANDRTDVTRYFDVDETKGYWTLKDSDTSKNSVTGGIITGFYANTGVLYNNGTFNMNGGSIVGCSAEDGIVYNSSSSTFNMNGGSIVGCAVYNSGAVHNWFGTFTMDGGSIKNCRAWGSYSTGGGVCNDQGATFNLVNGSIKNCKATNGSGVYLKAGGTFNLGGKNNTQGVIDITDNANEDIYLAYNINRDGYTPIHITEAGMAPTSAIKVNASSASQPPTTVISGLTETSKNYFQCVKTGYSFLYNTDGSASLEKNYRVTFDVNGGDALSDNALTTNESGKLESLPTPTRNDYRFDGWFTQATGGTNITTGTVFNAHTTIYAHWTELPDYEISNPVVSGGIVSSDKTTAKAGKTVTLTVSPWTHWHLDTIAADYTGEEGLGPVTLTPVTGATNKYTFTMPNGDVTITAAFEMNTYTITFDANDHGTVNVTSQTTNTNRLLNSLPSPVANENYVFDGWFSERDGGTQVTMDTVFNGNMTVYAHWTYTGGGGGGGGSYTPSYTVTVPTNTKNGSVSVDTKNAKPGSTVTITLTPDAGYTVDTITVLDKNGKAVEVTPIGNGKYTFKMPSGKVEIQATFSEDNAMLNFFVDVPTGSYYANAVLWAVKNGVTKGTTDTTFSPEASCSRAQLVTFLWRVAGCPVVNYAMNFSDVAEDAFYSEAIRWAASLNIVGGYGNGIFGTNDTITREQVVAILYRFAVAQGIDLSAGEDTNILSYNDALQIAEYAMDAFQWACGAGIVQGNNGNLMPNQPCTRAQIVTMLYRLLGE